MSAGEEFRAGGTATANTCSGNRLGTLGYGGGGGAAGAVSGGDGQGGTPLPSPRAAE